MQVRGNQNPFASFGAFGANGSGMDPAMQAQLQMMMMAFMQQAMMQLFNMLFQGGLAQQGGCGCGGVGGARGGGNPWGGGNFPVGGNNFPIGAGPNGPSSAAGMGALGAARSQLGVREASGRNDGVPANRYSGGRREPWCANFVAWSFRQAGTPIPGNQRSLASVQQMENRMKQHGMFHRGTPQPGDIIFFSNRGGSDRGGGRHVGIVERVENGRVHTIEGNSSNAVRRRSYDLNNRRISGYGRVGGPAAAGANATPNAGAVNATAGGDPNTAARLNRVLGGQFAGQGAAFAAAAQRHGLNPDLLAAIAMHETGNGTSNAVRSYNNPGGLMNPRTNWSTLQRFGSLSEGIDRMASNLKRNYIDKGITSIPAIGRKYAPVGAANDPRGLNQHWANGVHHYLNQIRG